MYPVGAAVVGAGFIGPVHVEALRRLGIKVTGILGVDEEESQRAKDALGLPRAYTSYDELLAGSRPYIWPCPTCCTTSYPRKPFRPAST